MTPTSPAELDRILRAATGVSIDTRTAQPDNVFFAIRGESFDGNRFASQALASGCAYTVVDDAEVATSDDRMLWVPDALKALQDAAHRYRNTWDFPVIALTGSNGKTTTKELLRDVLGSTFRVAATVGNFNNEIGVPLTLLRMPSTLDMAIVEMGANAQGEIRALVEIAAPTHALITNIGLAHLEGFGGPEGVKKGKSEIFSAMHETGEGVAFANAKHDALLEVTEGLNPVRYGTAAHLPEVRPADGNWGAFAWRDIDSPELWRGPVPTALEGAHNLENIATALAVGRWFGVSPEAAEQAIAAYIPTNNRSEWQDTGRNRVLLDAYNANPSSMVATLRYLQVAETEGELLLVLGQMGELGLHSASGHRDVAKAALDLVAEKGGVACFVGEEFAAIAGDLSEVSQAHWCADIDEASQLLSQWNPVGRTVLLKGSRSVALESLRPLL